MTAIDVHAPHAPLNINSFEKALALGSGSRARAKLDLSAATFVDTYALVGIACVALANSAEGRETRLVAPASHAASNYLARMKFDRLLGERCDSVVSLPPVHHAAAGDVLVELQWFDAGDNLEGLVDLLFTRLKAVVPGDVLREIIESLCEIGDNTRFHAQVDGGVMAAQVYSRNTQRARIDLAIGDVGIGIRESLVDSGRYAPANDLEAIELALQLHVTSLEDEARGVGLPTVAENVRGVGGKVKIRSGAGSRVLYPIRGAVNMTSLSLPGTVVGVSIPCR